MLDKLSLYLVLFIINCSAVFTISRGKDIVGEGNHMREGRGEGIRGEGREDREGKYVSHMNFQVSRDETLNQTPHSCSKNGLKLTYSKEKKKKKNSRGIIPPDLRFSGGEGSGGVRCNPTVFCDKSTTAFNIVPDNANHCFVMTTK